MYKDEYPDVKSLPLSVVIDILYLSDYWDVHNLFSYIQKEIAIKLLSPRSLDEGQDIFST